MAIPPANNNFGYDEFDTDHKYSQPNANDRWEQFFANQIKSDEDRFKLGILQLQEMKDASTAALVTAKAANQQARIATAAFQQQNDPEYLAELERQKRHHLLNPKPLPIEPPATEKWVRNNLSTLLMTSAAAFTVLLNPDVLPKWLNIALFSPVGGNISLFGQNVALRLPNLYLSYAAYRGASKSLQNLGSKIKYGQVLEDTIEEPKDYLDDIRKAAQSEDPNLNLNELFQRLEIAGAAPNGPGKDEIFQNLIDQHIPISRKQFDDQIQVCREQRIRKENSDKIYWASKNRTTYRRYKAVAKAAAVSLAWFYPLTISATQAIWNSGILTPLLIGKAIDLAVHPKETYQTLQQLPATIAAFIPKRAAPRVAAQPSNSASSSAANNARRFSSTDNDEKKSPAANSAQSPPQASNQALVQNRIPQTDEKKSHSPIAAAATLNKVSQIAQTTFSRIKSTVVGTGKALYNGSKAVKSGIAETGRALFNGVNSSFRWAWENPGKIALAAAATASGAYYSGFKTVGDVALTITGLASTKKARDLQN